MVRPSLLLALPLSRFVCVRVTDMSGVDLARYAFDFDLTFCALLQRADGHLYHTFGGRTWEHAQSHVSVPAFIRALDQTLIEHAQAARIPPRPPTAARTVEMLPPLARRIEEGKRPDCIHCHSVHDWQAQSAMEAGTWERDDAWVYPDPRAFGFAVDPIEQNRVTEVAAHLEAEEGGTLAIGDRVVAIEGTPTFTFGDLTRALDAIGDATAVSMLIERPGANGTTRVDRTLTTRPGWRAPDPLHYSWRSMKWNLEPAPGFGGPALDAAALDRLGLPTGAFAFRVQYLVTWGHRAYTGRNAQRAGIRKGDVVTSVGGKRDFVSVAHFHAWFRLTRAIGSTVAVEVIRGGERRTIELPVVGPGS